MGLGLPVNVGGGEFKRIVKYDARAGRIHRSDRVEANGSFENRLTEITNGFAAIFDLKNIEVGYAHFAKGAAPAWQVVKIGQPLPQKPSKEYKQAFKLDIKLAKSLGGDVREFGSAAGCVIAAMDQLYDAYTKAPEAAAGKLPVVAITSTTMVKSGESTNYAPNFQITSWVDRPGELPLDPVAPANAQAPLSTPANVPPPVGQPAPAQTASIATEF
jgi:hypothetical protein